MEPYPPQSHPLYAMEPSLPLPGPPPSTAVGRRLPPPCWSHEETVALIDSYRDKWYSLRRGNLRAVHWQEVADAVGSLCPHSSPAKTSVQCRHKMEKLRKRYRSELQRALSIPNHRFASAWVYFRKMDDMEKGPTAVESSCDEDDDDVVAMDYDDDDYLFGGYDDVDFNGSVSNGGGFGIQVPSSSASRFRSNNPNFSYSCGLKYTTRVIGNGVATEPESSGGSRSAKKSKEGGGVKGVVAAIKLLGEGFVKVEKMKMDMMRDIEQTRMEMEMKRTEMILESQQLLVDAFVKGISERTNKSSASANG